jgi:hypothetical protein
MSGGETNEPILDSNISQGHGHQSSPSRPWKDPKQNDSVCHNTRERNTLTDTYTHSSGRVMTSVRTIVHHGHGAEGERKVTNRLSGVWALADRPAR